MNSFEEADTIDVLDEEDFDEAQTSDQNIHGKITAENEANNDRTKQQNMNNNRGQENKPERKSLGSVTVTKRKRSASDDSGPEHGPKIKVAGPWERHDRMTKDKSGSFVIGESNSYRESTSHKPPFVQPFIKKMFSLASNPNKCNNALQFTDRNSIRDGRAIRLTQVRKNDWLKNSETMF